MWFKQSVYGLCIQYETWQESISPDPVDSYCCHWHWRCSSWIYCTRLHRLESTGNCPSTNRTAVGRHCLERVGKIRLGHLNKVSTKIDSYVFLEELDGSLATVKAYLIPLACRSFLPSIFRRERWSSDASRWSLLSTAFVGEIVPKSWRYQWLKLIIKHVSKPSAAYRKLLRILLLHGEKHYRSGLLKPSGLRIWSWTRSQC